MISGVAGVQRASYLRVEFAGVVQKARADVMKSPDVARVVHEAIKGPAADISSAQQTLLDLHYKHTETQRRDDWVNIHIYTYI